MKYGAHFKILGGFVLLIATIQLYFVLEDKCKTYDPVSYIQAWLLWDEQEDHLEPVNAHGKGKAEDKIIVVAKLKEEDVSWITVDLAE